MFVGEKHNGCIMLCGWMHQQSHQGVGKRFYRIPEVYGLGVDTTYNNALLQVIDGRFSGFFPIVHLTDSNDPS